MKEKAIFGMPSFTLLYLFKKVQKYIVIYCMKTCYAALLIIEHMVV